MSPGARIRKFSWQDTGSFTCLFNEINELTDSGQAYDTELMRQFLSQPSCQPEDNCYLAEDTGSLVGFAMMAPELQIGRIVASGGVSATHRNKGIGRRLTRCAVEHATGLKASILNIQVPSKDEPASHIMGSEGFSVVRSYWQMRWEGDQVPPLNLPDEFSVRPFRLAQDEGILTELQNATFEESWGFCPNTAEEISARVRLQQCQPDGIIFIIDGTQPVAYNWTMQTNNPSAGTGLISMTGVHPKYRNKGLGRAALAAGMEYLKSRGADYIELEVDVENVPARVLYLNVGFKVTRRTLWFEKQLT